MFAIDNAQNRSNPIVERYITTDLGLRTIIQNTPEPRSPAAQSLLYIEECLKGKRLAKAAIRAAQAVPINGSDPELLVLMLSSWAELSCRIGRPSEAEALMRRAKVLISDITHPEIRARSALVESILADTTGNKARREQILREILKFLSAHSPRRKFYLWELAVFLAQQGRGVESQNEYRELSWQTNERFSMNRVLMAKFINAVETGDIQEAVHIMPQLHATPHLLSHLPGIHYNGYQALVNLMHHRIEKKQSPLPELQWSPDIPAWVKVVHHLLSRQTKEALRLARLEANRMLGSIFAAGFDSFNLIRAELASGKWEGARRLLKMRQGRGNRHYMDDFFFARAELLSGNHKMAAQYFAEVLKSVEYYHANGRLNFELRLACELSHGDIVQLTQSAEKIIHRSGHISKATLQPPVCGIREPVPEETISEMAHGVDQIVGRSAAISEIRRAITRFADTSTPILITGETGTGKELVAYALHAASKKKDQPFIPVNCGSITETLLESELFGHERGAFTGAEKTTKGLFEEAGTGTILLDEIGDISMHLQGALLRVFETGEIRAVGSGKTRKINCRIIAATNADLNKLANEGRFRKDLFFRLQRLGIHIPPLRERREDISVLFRHFLDVDRRIGDHAKVSEELMATICSYDWPGNVRELKNVIERMRLMHSDKLSYELGDLDIKFQSVTQGSKERSSHATPEKRLLTGEPDEETLAVNAGSEREESVPDSEVHQILRRSKSPIRRHDRLLEIFSEHHKLTRTEVIEILGVSANTATKYLKALCEEGHIERIQPSASTRSHYFVMKEPANGL